jgi:oligoribonuclease
MQNVAWIDLETTGTDEHKDSIIEIACIVTNKQWVEQDRVNIIIKPDPMPENISPVVLDMHTKNGLWNDVVSNGIPIKDADWKFNEFLGQYLGGAKSLVLAGSGVSHFDSRFIHTQLPISAQRLTFWTYDVSVVRRFFECAGIKGIKNVKKHRAMGDVEQHLADWITALERMKTHE